MYWDSMRRLEAVQSLNIPGLANSVNTVNIGSDYNIVRIPHNMSYTPLTFYHMDQQSPSNHGEKKFNFHKLAESATDDKIKRKTKPKKEYICR